MRADNVRELAHGIEYTPDHRTHHISPDSVTGVNGCARVSVSTEPKEEEHDCIPVGEPVSIIRAVIVVARLPNQQGGPYCWEVPTRSLGKFS